MLAIPSKENITDEDSAVENRGRIMKLKPGDTVRSRRVTWHGENPCDPDQHARRTIGAKVNKDATHRQHSRVGNA
jgi:hypothetical protein